LQNLKPPSFIETAGKALLIAYTGQRPTGQVTSGLYQILIPWQQQKHVVLLVLRIPLPNLKERLEMVCSGCVERKWARLLFAQTGDVSGGKATGA